MMETANMAGDRAQLAYIRDRYNYLLNEKMKLEEAIRAAKLQSKCLDLNTAELLKIKTELLHLDYTRTAMVNPLGVSALAKCRVKGFDEVVYVDEMIRGHVVQQLLRANAWQVTKYIKKGLLPKSILLDGKGHWRLSEVKALAASITKKKAA